jgi:tripartite-type tricarboxylate transporter receptor subunit TctC
MVATRAGTSPDVVAKLHAELKAALALPEIRDTISRSGMIPQDSASPEEWQRYMASEIVRWGKIVKDAGAAGIELLFGVQN